MVMSGMLKGANVYEAKAYLLVISSSIRSIQAKFVSSEEDNIHLQILTEPASVKLKLECFLLKFIFENLIQKGKL